MRMADGTGKAREILRDVFGYERFRPLQEEIIASVLAGKDALVVMPTGGGKSICYQIPALLFKGLTVVVSPLISLMKDQVDQMRELGVGALLLNSSLSREEYLSNMDMVRGGRAKLLYVAPETLLKHEILSLLASVRVDCFAIDEAHCISEWGHDFRPEYRMIARVRAKFKEAVCVALTATATARVRDDIRQSLELNQSSLFIASFNRENLFYRIAPKSDPLRQTLDFLREHEGESGIIYAFSRDSVERISLALAKLGYSARPYHAGLTDEERRENQELFLKDEVRIIVATIAFGMGIHKTNVRFVVHFDLPKSVEAYYQETGRAGRDGVNSTCLLLFSYSDIHKIRYFIDRKTDETEKRVAASQLEALVRFADCTGCRRVPLLKYFGEEYGAESCGMCDNCVHPPECGDNITVQARMFLSCVKRTGERFGAGHVIDVLRGSRSRKTLEMGHCALSTYGIGKDISKSAWLALCRQFVQKGLVVQDMESFGALKITDSGYRVMKGLESVAGSLSRKDTDYTSPAGGREYDVELFELLRDKRRALAAAANVPPYVIFSDKTLIAIASAYPRTRESLSRVHGIGSRKIEQYGDTILSLVKEHLAARGIEPAESGPLPTAPRASLKVPRYVQIGELFNAGMSIADIETEQGIKVSTIISNLTRYAQEGHALRRQGLAPLIPADTQTLTSIMNAFESLGGEYLKPVFDELRGSVDYDTLQACRLYYLGED